MRGFCKTTGPQTHALDRGRDCALSKERDNPSFALEIVEDVVNLPTLLTTSDLVTTKGTYNTLCELTAKDSSLFNGTIVEQPKPARSDATATRLRHFCDIYLISRAVAAFATELFSSWPDGQSIENFTPYKPWYRGILSICKENVLLT
jgi:hypothetical protein